MQELNDYGGILMSHPDEQKRVKKYHLCKICYQKLISDITK